MLQHACQFICRSLQTAEGPAGQKFAFGPIFSAVLMVGIFVSCPIRAELASQEEMHNVSQNFVTEKVARAGQWAGVTTPELGEAHELWYEGMLVARYYDVSPRGYVLVSVLKEMNPIKAYSDESNSDADQEGGFLQLMGEVLYRQMRLYESLYGGLDAAQSQDRQLFDPSQKSAWDRLSVATKDFRLETALGTTSQAGPLLTSSWHQREPYNNSCPMMPSGRTVVGCVATAAAQILKYWEWPPSGVGSHIYLWREGEPPQYLTADYQDSYDWGNMPDNCDGGCSAAQADAAAELCYEVGVAFNTSYGTSGSGAPGQDAQFVFPAYFRYKLTSGAFSRVDYTQQEWFDLVRAEIDAGRPVFYLIFAHAIVCDGYSDDETLSYHMNYGWNDSHNAWYVLDNLSCPWYPGGICPLEDDIIIAGIEPQHDPELSFVASSAWDVIPDRDSLTEAGETGQLQIVMKGSGSDVISASGILSTSDPYLTITAGEKTFDPVIVWGAESTTQTPFEFTVDPGCPNRHVALLNLDIIAEGGYNLSVPVQVFIGDRPGFADDMESQQHSWKYHPFTLSYLNEWHLESARSYSGTTSWKVGGLGSEGYSDYLDGALVTPPLLLPADGKLSFQHWMDAEIGLDGAIVMVSCNGGEWFQVYPQGGYPCHTVDYSSCALGKGIPCYSGAQDWNEAVFDLSSLTGVVEIMFRFSSTSSMVVGQAEREGWYVDDVWVGNTVEGTDIQVMPLPDLTVTFGSVLAKGSTIGMMTETGPPPPPGYAPVPGSPTKYYDLTTDAAFTGNVSICIIYDETGVIADESTLKLLHYEGDAWVDVTSALNTATNQICGTATSLSPFLVAEKLTCCEGRVGDANGSNELTDEVTLGDIMLMVDVLFISNDCTKFACPDEADVNQSGGPNPPQMSCLDYVSLGDIMTLVDFLFITGPQNSTLPDCL